VAPVADPVFRKNTGLTSLEKKKTVLKVVQDSPLPILNTRGGVRTCDLFLRREALYPAELREHETRIISFGLVAWNDRHVLDLDRLDRPFSIFRLDARDGADVIHAVDDLAKNGVAIVEAGLAF
jgi:hypothetical protein